MAGLANAGDLLITESETTPRDTATGDGTGPGSINIENVGSIELETGVPLTVNSSHDIANSGTMTTDQEVDATGVLVSTSQLDPSSGQTVPLEITSTITNNGSISLPGPASDSDLFSARTNNVGIRVEGTGTLRGSISNTTFGRIVVGGVEARGISINSSMVGTISNEGDINAAGPNAVAIALNGPVIGNFFNTRSIAASGEATVGVYIGGGLTGAVIHTGSIDVGLGSFFQEDGTISDPLSGDAGLWIASSISNGIYFEGNGLTDTEEANLQITDRNAFFELPEDSTISALGSGNVVRIAPGGLSGSINNIEIGTIGTGDRAFALINRGDLSSTSNLEGVDVLGFDIRGAESDGRVFKTFLAGGIKNDKGNVTVVTTDATARGMRIGNYATVESFINDGDFIVAVGDSTEIPDEDIIGTIGGNAFGIVVEAHGALPSFSNTGLFRVDAGGDKSSAFGLIDRSGTLTSFSNTNEYEITNREGSTGTVTALEASASDGDFTFFNSGSMSGDVFLGNGDITFTLIDGSLTGDLSMGSGDGLITIANSKLDGKIDLGNGVHIATVTDSTINSGLGLGLGIGSTTLTASNVDWTIPSDQTIVVDTATFDGGSSLTFGVGGIAGSAGGIQATGLVSIAADTVLTPVVTGVVQDQQTFTLINAGTLDLQATIDETLQVETSFMHNVRFAIDSNNPNILTLEVERKSARVLKLETNTTELYNASAIGLLADPAVFAAISAQTTRETFEAALQQLQGDISNATVQTALNNQNLALSVIRRRMDRIATTGFRADNPSFWYQQYGQYASKSSDGEIPGYSSWTTGLSFGLDRQITESMRAGVGINQAWSFPDEKNSLDAPTEISSTQLHFYMRSGSQRRYIQGVIGGALNSHNSEREILIDDLNRTALGNWSGHQLGGSAEAAFGFIAGMFQVIPSLRAQYTRVHENDYEETGGGAGVNLAISSKSLDSLRAGMGFTVDTRFAPNRDAFFEAQLRGSYMQEFLDTTAIFTSAFAATNAEFVNVGDGPNKSTLSTGLGLSYKNDNASLGIDYDYAASNGYSTHAGVFTIRFRF